MCFKFENLSRNKLSILKDICVDIIDKKNNIFFSVQKNVQSFSDFLNKI